MTVLRQRPEQQIQAAVVDYLRLALPGALVFAVPNNPRLPTPGMYAGMTDAVIDWRSLAGVLVGYMEVKTKTGKLTPAQKEFRDFCQRTGRPWACVRSVEEAETALVAWGWKPRATARGVA